MLSTNVAEFTTTSSEVLFFLDPVPVSSTHLITPFTPSTVSWDAPDIPELRSVRRDKPLVLATCKVSMLYLEQNYHRLTCRFCSRRSTLFMCVL